MAWRCSGNSNLELIQNLRKANIIKSDKVFEAMVNCDRKNYCLSKSNAYEDTPLSLNYGATISAPHMHGYALEHLKDYLKEGSKVLDVGSGSGYLCGCFATMVGLSGKVIGIEHVQQLVDFSKNNLRTDDKLDNVQVYLGDGRLGYPSQAPYDCIHVGAASKEFPNKLIEQLKAPGRIFIPIGTSQQSIYLIDKAKDGAVTSNKIMDVSYVPLTDLNKQM